MITQKVVDACGLKPSGITQVHGVHGPEYVETFLVNVALPGQVMIPGLRVSLAKQLPEADILIGMDVIVHGDFAVTNADAVTKFSFRVPPVEHIDFVEDLNERNTRQQPQTNRAERRRREKDEGRGGG